MKKILFVCTGNSCRSIMAEAYFNKRAAESGLSAEAASAGTLGMNGAKPTKETIKVLQDEGIDPEGYESKELTPEAGDWADIILVMEPMHKERVAEISPEAERKIYFLGNFNKEKGDILIPDPIGRQLAFYRVTFNAIKDSVDNFIKWLKQREETV